MLSAIDDRAKTTAQERVQQHVGKMVRALCMWVRSVGVCVSEREGESVCVCVCLITRLTSCESRRPTESSTKPSSEALNKRSKRWSHLAPPQDAGIRSISTSSSSTGRKLVPTTLAFSLVRFGMLTRSKQQTKSSVCVFGVGCWVLGGGGEGGHTNEGEPTGRVLTPAIKPKGRERRLRSLTRAQPAWGNPHNGPIIRQMPTATQPLPTEHSRSTVSG